jgi:succinoglycan biosynthesis protein ExoM
MPVTRRPSVTIAVLTYLRPEDIVAALPPLLEQATAYAGDASVLVVDNDPRASARSYVEDRFGPLVRYVVEPTPGIAAARNRAIDEITTDLLVFIDDDERPRARWLELLVDQYLRFPGTLGVVGRVESLFERPPEPWIVAGGFFDRMTRHDGEEVFVVATNNLLLDRRQLDELALRFDVGFGLSGGSDTLFSREARVQGRSFRACPDAVVDDVVPAERITRTWVLKRAYRMGNSWSRTLLVVTDGGLRRWTTRLRLTLGGAARVVAGAGQRALGVVTGSLPRHAQGTCLIYRGAGIVAGAWGHEYAEYARAEPISR